MSTFLCKHLMTVTVTRMSAPSPCTSLQQCLLSGQLMVSVASRRGKCRHAPFKVSNILRPSSRMPLCLRTNFESEHQAGDIDAGRVHSCAFAWHHTCIRS